jgi:hypothetical protein
MNLFGRFKVTTEPSGSPDRNSTYTGDIKFKIVPGLFPDGSKVEVALHKGESGNQTSATFQWFPYDPNSKTVGNSSTPIETKKNGLFDPGKMYALFYVDKGSVKSVGTSATSITHFTGDELLATVTIHLGNEKNVIRCRKLVMKPGKVYGMTIGDSEEMSDIYK